MAKLRVTYVKSAIGYPEDQKRTIAALGLKKLRQSAEFEDSGSSRGMIMKVRHLVKVEAVEGPAKAGKAAVKRARRVSAKAEETT